MGRDQTRPMTRKQLEAAYEQAVRDLAARETIHNHVLLLPDVAEELAHVLQTNIGYWRIGYDHVGELFWARWKWTEGYHKGHYVFASQESIQAAVGTVCGHISDVNGGKRKPLLDKWKGTNRG